METITCPALNNEKIYFNNSGFTHLMRKGGKLRAYSEQKRRFSALKFCKEILTLRDPVIEYRQINNVQFWMFKTIKDNLEIKLVIRQIDSNPKHFFSIMGKKKKHLFRGVQS